MRSDLKDFLHGGGNPAQDRNRLRELLQTRILASLQRAGAMIPLAFQGGTALRFLYSLKRYSEDLDFALERPDRGYDFRAFLERARGDVLQEGFEADVKWNDQKVVHSAFISFPGLLFDLGLSLHRNEKLSVKVEVDTRPPAGATLETTLVRRHSTPLQLQHHDKSSLLAGKLHAILQRTYPKGRDLYDLIWYLSDRDWPAPNLVLLNNALRQTEWNGPALDEETWRSQLAARIHELDWERVALDVRPFLEDAREVGLMTRENVLALL